MTTKLKYSTALFAGALVLMQLPEITHAQEIQIQNAPKVATAIPDSLLRRLETTPAALERMKSDDLWTNTTVNAAGAVLDQTRRYAEVGLGYATSDGDFNRPQGGRYRSDLLFNTEGGGSVGKFYMWGAFDYTRSKIKDALYNCSVADPFRGMPYYLADLNPSDWVHQNYDLQARLASPRIGRTAIFGLNLRYRNTIAAKQVDPRPETYYYKIDIQPSVIFTLGEHHNIGLTFEYYNLREDVEMTLSNLEQAQHFFIMKGLGYFTSDLGGNYVRRQYNGNSVGGELQYNFKGDVNLIVTGSWARKVEDVTVPIATQPKKQGSVVDDRLKVSLAANTTTRGGYTHSVRLSYQDRAIDGIEYVQKYDNNYESQDWITIWKGIRSQYRTHHIDFNYDLMRGYEAEYSFRTGVLADYNRQNDIYLVPTPSTTELISNTKIGAYFKKNFRFGSRYNGRLLCGLTAQYNINLDGTYDYHGTAPDSEIVKDFMYLDLAIRSADYFDGAAEVTYSRNLNLSSNSTFFVRLNGRYWKANLAESYKTYDSRYMVHLTAGLNF